MTEAYGDGSKEGIVVIGTSLGGLAALEVLLARLPRDFPLPVAVVQHRSAESGDMLKIALQRYSTLRVREPQDKEPIVPGHVYVAPADYHLLIEDHSFALSTEGPVIYARPSIDVLFETAARAYRRHTVGVVLTGASADGARGAARIKEWGGVVVAQEPETAECALMPKSTIQRAKVDRILPLEQIPAYLDQLSRGQRPT